MLELLRRSIGPLIEIAADIAAGPVAGARRRQPARAGAAQSRRQRARRDAGGRPLTLSARNATSAAATDDALAAGDYVCLTVADTGAAWTRRRWRAPPSRSSPPRASARAPASACRWCTAWRRSRGGALRLSSRPGGGTTAELWLPRAEALPRASAAAPRAGAAAPRPCTVLLVDDDALVSMATTARCWRISAIRCVEAPSGSKALEILRAGAAGRPGASPTRRCPA